MGKIKTKIKAFFLLFFFSLNTIAGFACSVGMDLYYNSDHHADELAAPVKYHSHEPTHNHKHKHPHSHSAEHKDNSKDKDDCCSNEVTKFIQLDKSVAGTFHLQAPIFLKTFPEIYLLDLQPGRLVAVNSHFQFVRRCCSLDDIDIRIAIQSFQI